MAISLECGDLFAEIDALLQANALTEAAARLEQIHLTYHDDAWIHMGVHAYFMRIAWRRRHWLRFCVELLAIPFVGPTSLVQRYLGLALPSRRNERDPRCNCPSDCRWRKNPHQSRKVLFNKFFPARPSGVVCRERRAMVVIDNGFARPVSCCRRRAARR